MTISTKLMVIFERSEISRRKLSMEKRRSWEQEARSSLFRLPVSRMPDHTLTRCTEQLMHDRSPGHDLQTLCNVSSDALAPRPWVTAARIWSSTLLSFGSG